MGGAACASWRAAAEVPARVAPPVQQHADPARAGQEVVAHHQRSGEPATTTGTFGSVAIGTLASAIWNAITTGMWTMYIQYEPSER